MMVLKRGTTEAQSADLTRGLGSIGEAGKVGQSVVGKGVASVVRKKGPLSYDRNITPFLKNSNPLELFLRPSHGSVLAARPPNVSASQCSRNPLGSVFMRRVSLPTASAEQYVPWWWCQLGTLHSFSLQRTCGLVQTMDS